MSAESRKDPTTRSLLLCYETIDGRRESHVMLDRGKDSTTDKELRHYCRNRNVVAIYAIGHSLKEKTRTKEGMIMFGMTIFTFHNVTMQYKELMRHPNHTLTCVVCIHEGESKFYFYDDIKKARPLYESLFKQYGPDEVAMV